MHDIEDKNSLKEIQTILKVTSQIQYKNIC